MSVVQTAPPQLSVFASQTPEMHTRVATSVEQVATVVGEEGSESPSLILSWQRPAPAGGASHHCVDMQSGSAVQPLVHKWLAVSQIGLSVGHAAEVAH